jgi:hypothetical protein
MNEDALLNRIAIEAALAQLDPSDRELIVLAFQYERLPGWTGDWPPSLSEIGRIWGLRWEGAPLSEATIRYKRDAIIAKWAGRGRSRKNRRKSHKNPKSAPD